MRTKERIGDMISFSEMEKDSNGSREGSEEEGSRKERRGAERREEKQRGVGRRGAERRGAERRGAERIGQGVFVPVTGRRPEPSAFFPFALKAVVSP